MKCDRVVVLCPMRIEYRAVSRAIRAAGIGGEFEGVSVVQTGVGKEAVVRAVREQCAGRTDIRLILAGACGGLQSVGDVPRIARIIDEHGGKWNAGDDGVTLIGVDRIVSSPHDKRQLASGTGAAIVDMESHGFAAECVRLGTRWSVVRGVSDTPEETLPGEVLGWITPGGDTRGARAAADMLRRPRLIGHVVPVLRRSRRVLRLVGERVVEVIRAGRPAGVNTGLGGGEGG